MDNKPAQPTKKSHKTRNIILGIIAALVLIGILAGSGKNTPAPTSTTKATVTPKATAQTSTKTTASTPPAQPKVLLDQSGNGQAQTAAFTTNSNWQITYTYDCSAFGSSGNFMITIDNKDGSPNTDSGANELGMSGGSTDHYYDAGTHYLQIDSECAWHVTVTD